MSTLTALGLLALLVGILLILFTVYSTVGWVALVIGIVAVVFGFTPYYPRGRR